MIRPLPTATTLAVLALLVSAPAFAAEVCGDVNQSSSVSSTDALLVLRKAVGQPITLTCPAIDDLAACLANTCGNDLAENGEACDGADLHGKTCATEAPDTPYGDLACDKECGGFDTSGCSARFDASGDTIIDHATGLEWEKKVGTAGDIQYCDFGGDCSNLHGVNNGYRWATTGKNPDGSAFVGFLAELNGTYDGSCHAGHCDWRIPTWEEMQGVRDLSACGSGACVNAAFLPDGGVHYWSVNTSSVDSGRALPFHTGNSLAGESDKPNAFRVRAVRTIKP